MWNCGAMSAGGAVGWGKVHSRQRGACAKFLRGQRYDVFEEFREVLFGRR